jgi:predicted GNAT family N-acyltransferase
VATSPVTYEKVESIGRFIDAIRLRVDVFIIEQKCPPGWEPDELDRGAVHYVAVKDDAVVGAARLREDHLDTAKIERMVTKIGERRQGVASGLTGHIVAEACRLGYRQIWLEAQAHAQGMYESLGFEACSEEYDQFDLGIPHVKMTKILRSAESDLAGVDGRTRRPPS